MAQRIMIRANALSLMLTRPPPGLTLDIPKLAVYYAILGVFDIRGVGGLMLGGEG